MLPLPPRLSFFLLGTLAGLVLTLTLLPHYHGLSSSTSSPFTSRPLVPDFSAGEDLELSSPTRGPGSAVTLEDVLGGIDGGVTGDGAEEGRVEPVSEPVAEKTEGFLRGEVGQGIFERLKPDEYYITAGASAGLTNQVFAIIDVLYLGLLSTRIPIVQPFHANHQVNRAPGTAPLPELAVSELFDLPRLVAAVPRLRGVVQWSDLYPSLIEHSDQELTRFANTEAERKMWPEVGCWGEFVKERAVEFARILPVWTPYPPLVSVPGRQMSYLAFVPYLLPSSPFAAALPNTTGVSLRPNDQLACLDEVMAGTDRADVTPYEELGTGKGSWAGIGKQLRFTPALEKEARRVVARAFGWEGEGKGKKHITLHIRHGDFLEFQCQPNDPCWSVEQFHSAVAQLQASLPSPVKDVLVLTDEIDPTFIAEARALGWKFAEDGMTGPGGEEIKKKLGGWYDTLLDTVLMSQGSHFVGTYGSTMSVLALRRVIDWEGGEVRLVQASDPI